MNKPIILAVDDDPHVLRAVKRDLRAKYGEEYRIAGADSGEAALELLGEWKRRGEVPALFLVDQRMPNMTGLELLERAAGLFPDARRVLLTAYADTDAAIAAINDVQLDHYLLKPWDPPEEKLHPVLSDLLDDWRLVHEPELDGIRVVGHQWTPDSHRVKDFLARNNVPYAWLDLASNPEARAAYDARYERAREARWRVFDQETAENDVSADRTVRIAALSLLYTARRNDADHPGMGIVEIERILGCPEQHMKFHMWYLKENGWIVRMEDGKWAITASGADKVMDLGGPMSGEALRLTAGSGVPAAAEPAAAV